MRPHPILLSLLCLLAVCILPACRKGGEQVVLSDGDTLSLKYASLLHITRHEGYTTVSIDHPWKAGSTLHRYVLVDKDKPLPHSLPQGTLVRTPVTKAVVFTTAHCQLMQWLNAEEQLTGVADLKYIHIDYVHDGVRRGTVADCGDAMNPVIEKIIDLRPDVLLVSPFENSGGYGQLEDIGIPLVECADYMEHSALARAEWMRFYGLLLGREPEADSLFNAVDSCYTVLKSLALKQQKPSVLTEKLTGATWYVPGGKSSVGQLIADAGGTYPWSGDNHSGSLAMTFETVLDKAGESDVWLFNHFGAGELTYKRLASEYAGYSQIKAFKNHNTWYVDTQRTPYFEEVSFHPDYLLRDFLILFHPALGLGEPRYYTPVR